MKLSRVSFCPETLHQEINVTGLLSTAPFSALSSSKFNLFSLSVLDLQKRYTSLLCLSLCLCLSALSIHHHMSYIFECQFHLFKELIHIFICVLLIKIFFFFAFSLFAKNKTYLLPNVLFLYSRPVIFFQLLRQLHTRSEELTY